MAGRSKTSLRRITGQSLAEAVDLPRTGPEPNDELEQDNELEETAVSTRRLGAGDAEAFRHLFDTYFDRLYRYAFRFVQSADEAGDVVHDVFLQVWRQRQRIGLERDLRNYLYATTRNHALDRLKHRKVEQRFRDRRIAALAAGEDVASAADPETERQSRELAAAVQKAMDTLPRRQRQVLELRWHGALSYDAIAKLLGISPKTVAIHLGRAFEHMRRSLPQFLE
jgi:RNA polymerase sigma-70 factor, ECF subfamily